MAKIIIAIPHSHSFFWVQTCLAHLRRFRGTADHDVRVVVVDNSPWSPSIRGVLETPLCVGVEVALNPKGNKFHASALDHVVETYDFDFLLAMETDVVVLREGWLDWFLGQMAPSDYAVGHFHHEGFVSPCCTLYRGEVLRLMNRWCKALGMHELRWGASWSRTAPLDNHLEPGDEERLIEWIAAPFAEKRGWPEGSVIEPHPTGQYKGPGWFEPGQQLHHWAVANGWTYTLCPTATYELKPGMPVQTVYGGETQQRTMEIQDFWEKAWCAHLWGGTRALDILKHPVTDPFVLENTSFWLQREARFWRDSVPPDVRERTLELIRKHGWYNWSCHHYGLTREKVPPTERDREAVALIEDCYRLGQVFV